jgi:dolichol-phosphate mannosyltransferase
MPPGVCKLSVVCPAFEEEEVLPRFHTELTAVLDRLGTDYDIEILYVDDGSRDGTLEVLRRLAASDPRVRYLSLSRNFGHQAALTAGLEHTSGDVVITLDADLQHPPALIPALLEKWRTGNDVVLTLREEDPRLTCTKRLFSRLFYRLMAMISDTELRASAADFRLMTRKAVDALLRLHETHRFLRGMVSWLGFRTATLPYTPASRAAGVSKYTVRKMLSLAVDGMLSFSRVPLRLSLVLGGLLATLGLGVGGWGIARAVFSAAAVDWGWLLMMTTVLLVGGCVLGAVGIVGEYVGRIYEQVKGRPIYLLKDASPELVAELDRHRPRRAA